MELRGVLESSDVAEIQAKTDALQEAWTEAASAIYAQASATTPPSGDGALAASGRRGDRGRRLRGGRRGGGQDLVSEPSRGRRPRRGPVERGRRRSADAADGRADEVEAAPIDELAEVTRERDEYLDALQRLKAEFDNYRKRVARDQADLVARASERLVKQLLPVLDDLERALEAAADARGGAARGRRPARAPRARRRARPGGPRRGRDRRRVRSAHAGGAALAAVRRRTRAR